MRVLVYISWPVKAWCIDDAHVETLRERFPDVDFVHAATAQDARRCVEEVDVAFTPFMTPEMVAAAPRLRWVHSSPPPSRDCCRWPILPRAESSSPTHGVYRRFRWPSMSLADCLFCLVGSTELEAQTDRRWIQNELSDDWPWMLHGADDDDRRVGHDRSEVAKRAHAFGMSVRRAAPRDLNRGHHSSIAFSTRSIARGARQRRSRTLGARRCVDPTDDRRRAVGAAQ